MKTAKSVFAYYMKVTLVFVQTTWTEIHKGKKKQMHANYPACILVDFINVGGVCGVYDYLQRSVIWRHLLDMMHSCITFA